MSTLYLIDGSGFIFRAFHALPPMTRADGVQINAVLGYCNMLNRLLTDSTASQIAVIFDAGRKTFRNEIYAEYKAHRPPAPPELIPQFPLIREATRAYGIPSIEAANYEADDLIAAYAKTAHAQGQLVRIVSSDKDLMQLIRPGVELFDPLKSIPIGIDEVFKKFGVTPDKVVDVQALAGDSTDNIPGVPGIGVKTAAELINSYGSLENLLSEAANIKQPKRRETLIVNAELARISLRLVTLDADAPLPVPLDQLRRQSDNKQELIAFLQAQGFRSLLSKLGASETRLSAPPTDQNIPAPHPAASPALPAVYELVQTEEQLTKWVEAARVKGILAIDTETDSLTASTAKLVGLSLAVEAGKACYIPVGHIDPQAIPSDGGFSFDTAPAPPQLNLGTVVKHLRELLVDSSILKIAHNLKYDLQVLAQHGLNVTPYDDTMLLSYVLSAGLHGHGLDDLAMLHFQHKMVSFDEVTGTGKNRITFDRVPLDKATHYAAEDADFTLRLWQLLKPQIAQQHVTTVYERIERPIVPVVAAMETLGVRIDPDILRQQSQGFAGRMQILETEIHALAGHPFNVASPKQLGEVLFEEMGLPGGARSAKSGAFSTVSDVLEPLAEAGHEIVIKLVDYRSVAKLKSTYTDALPEQISAKTGRVHTSFSLVGASTGRLSSTDPNLQNIPIRTEDGRAIRRAFIAADGYTLLSVDYSQIELRLAAATAGISALIQAFHDGVDIHALTASQVLGLPLSEITPDKRRAAKAINFGIIYGISGFGLAKQIGVSPAEAGEFIKQYLNRFHELRDWMEATKQFAHANGYVETLFGRRIHIAGIHDKGPRRGGAERQAINAPLQGTAADIMKRAMIRIPPAFAEAGLGARMLIQVHDELVFEVPVTELDATIKLVKHIMETAPAPALILKVPLVAEAGHAANWAEAH